MNSSNDDGADVLWCERSLNACSTLLILGVLVCTSACRGEDDDKPQVDDMPAAVDMPADQERDVPDLTEDMPADLGATEEMDVQDMPADMPPVQPGARLRFDPASEAFFDVPFPSDTRRDETGRPQFKNWEKAYRNNVLKLWFNATDDLVSGFSPVAGFFLTFDAPLDDDSLPTIESSTSTQDGWPSIALVDVDADSPERGRMFPLECRINTFEGRLRVANQVGCIPPWGVMRRVNTEYAIVVTRDLRAADGEATSSSEAMQSLLAGQDVEGRFGTVPAKPYVDARDFLVEQGLDTSSIMAIDLFTTGDPTARLRRINTFYRALPEPTVDEVSGLAMVKDYGEYFVVEGHYSVPIIQEGSFPYNSPPSGKVVFDEQGNVQQVDTQRIRFYLTLPRAPMASTGYPTLMYLHGSGGVSQQLMERGPYGEDGSPPPEGSGPARVIAPYGIAGFAADFQFHGMRYDPPDTSGLVLYNLFGNPRGTIDNFLVAANEVTLHARLLRGLVIDPTTIRNLPAGSLDLSASADGLIRFDEDAFVTMGQSMGSTIGLPAATIDDYTDATILSGSGGSLIEIASTSSQPVDVSAVLRTFLSYKNNEPLDQFDPVLHILQHVWDLVDPLAYSPNVFQEPFDGIPAKHVLQHSGIMDGYFSPEGRAGLSAALGVTLVAPELEPVALDIMRLVGLEQVLMPPVSGNHASGVTAVVTQYQPSVLDGHHVAYQRDDAKAQYACFVKTLAITGIPVLAAVPDASVQDCGAP